MGSETLKSIDLVSTQHIRFITNRNTYTIKFRDPEKFLKPENFTPENNIVDYCIVENVNSIANCASLFLTGEDLDRGDNYVTNLDNKSLRLSTKKCKTFIFRPGSVLEDNPIENEFTSPYILNGNYCELNFTGPIINKQNIKNCCIKQNCILFKDEQEHKLIKSQFSNGFETNNCNDTMMELCALDPKNPICLKWFKKRIEKMDHSVIDTYLNYCSSNLNTLECKYVINILRDNNFLLISDKILDNYCSSEDQPPECTCYLANKSETIKNMVETLGPTECWLEECNFGLKDNIFLSSDQLENKSNCNPINCIINVNSITANKNSTINLLNYCVNNNSFSYVNKTQNFFKHQTWGSQLNIFIFILSLIILIFFSFSWRQK